MARSLGRRNRGVGLQRAGDHQRAVDRILRLPEAVRSSCAPTDNTEAEPSRRCFSRLEADRRKRSRVGDDLAIATHAIHLSGLLAATRVELARCHIYPVRVGSDLLR